MKLLLIVAAASCCAASAAATTSGSIRKDVWNHDMSEHGGGGRRRRRTEHDLGLRELPQCLVGEALAVVEVRVGHSRARGRRLALPFQIREARAARDAQAL